MDQILKEAWADREYVINLRREFHREPELGVNTFKTAEKIERELDLIGVPHARIGKAGVVGIIRGALPGDRMIALRADTDALPITEVSNEPYCSVNPGVMHACGHDAHIAGLIGGARILAAHRDEFAGEARLIFQPGEELGQGLQEFFGAGVLEGAGRAFGIHMAPDLPAGSVGIKKGPNNASVDQFFINLYGKSSHISTPHKGADAIAMAVEAINAMQTYMLKCNSPVEPILFGVGRLSGGTTYNALAEKVEIEGTVRAFSEEKRVVLKNKVDEVFCAMAAMYGGRADVVWHDNGAAVINSDRPCDELKLMVDKTWGEGHVITDRELSFAGDNFADFMIKGIQGVYVHLGTQSPDVPGSDSPLHSVNFTIDENVLPFAAHLHASYALWYLSGIFDVMDKQK